MKLAKIWGKKLKTLQIPKKLEKQCKTSKVGALSLDKPDSEMHGSVRRVHGKNNHF